MKYRIIKEIDEMGDSEFYAEILDYPSGFFGIFRKQQYYGVGSSKGFYEPKKFKSAEETLDYLKTYYFPKKIISKERKIVIEDEV